MEWLTSIRTAIDYMEEHLTDQHQCAGCGGSGVSFSVLSSEGILSDDRIRYRRVYQEPKAVPGGVGSEGDG